MTAAKRPASPRGDAPETLADPTLRPPDGGKRRRVRRGTSKARVSTPGSLASDMERHNLRLLEQCFKDGAIVTLPDFDLDAFSRKVQDNRIPLAQAKPQPGLKPLRLSAADGPRLVFTKKGDFIMFFAPEFWGVKTQQYLLDAVDSLDQEGSPLKKDSARSGGDKRVLAVEGVESRFAQWGLHHHGIGQQFKHTLRPSPSLRSGGGATGVAARKGHLTDRTATDLKVNHMVDLINPVLNSALVEAKDKVAERSEEGASWVKSWSSNFLNQAIYENRQTKLHRDANGAPYCAEFLTLLGDFTGGDLFLPDINLTLEWLPNSACMFDGRTFAHEVRPWQGTRRICLVNYIWETSMNDLKVKLPERAPKLEEIKAQLEKAKGQCNVSSFYITF
ncbi:hypothetical protein FS749_002740 [Ceratobasidium sp. UAMH 11750]|nr:hypothetical protein FS749_002740 [Ceratobasidium sp. UAMH 11750]